MVASFLQLIEGAIAEVEAAELGCGNDDGECTCPCHVGVRVAAQ